MPIYEYLCSACGHELEVLQKLSDPALTDCPACDKPSLRKQISAAGFQLKGSGWYQTDFKNNGKGKAGAEAKPEAKPETKGEGGAETKPAKACGTGCGCH